MAMAGKIKVSFHAKVLLIVLALCWIPVGVFMVFQYQREKEFKTLLLDTRLQTYNSLIIEDIRHGDDITQAIRKAGTPVEGLRVTLIDRNGDVIFDNNDRTPFPTTNHNDRPEVKDARKYGNGHASERHSESDDVNYFYSATDAGDGKIIRSAAPYSHTLQEILSADGSLLWIMAVITVVMSLIAYLATRKVSLSIKKLNDFAEKAEKRERIFNHEAFPDDELGSIASHIVRLYIQRDEQHREAMRQEQDKIRLKKQLTNNINHELKTPVASILICLDLIADHPELSEEKKRDFFKRIRTNALRLDSLLKDVADITRIDEGQERISKTDIDLTETIKNIVEEEQLRTDIRIITSGPCLDIYGNPHLIESIFRNLIDNAIAYSDATEIRIENDEDGNFTVSDNGVGIPEEHLPHIFERFYRIDKGRSRAAGGTGLGLAIVKNAVAFHGGKISVASSKGLVFRFNLKINKKAT